jgi:hypothetical protein
LNARARLIVLFGLFGATAALYWWIRTQGGTAAAGSIADTLASAGDSIVSTIRGIRNNNPGNIKYNVANDWQGQTGQDSGGFATFDTEANGIRAIAVILKNYSSHYGLNTVDGLIRRWSATDQDAYVANVSAALGVSPYDSIDITDTATLTTVVDAIIAQEDSRAAELALSLSGAIDSGIASA